MAGVIHIELNLLFMIILVFIARQNRRNVNQQMKRVFFRNTIVGIFLELAMDAFWVAIDGKVFPGGILLNKITNAACFAIGVVVGSVWYLYVMESLGIRITRKLTALVMMPAVIGAVIGISTIWTKLTFDVTDANVYVRGPFFFVQELMALLMVFVSFLHLILYLLSGRDRGKKQIVYKLLSFYILPFIGTILSMPFSGAPATWPCAAVSVILIYLDAQDNEILQDSLTGLNNRKKLEVTYPEYAKMISETRKLYMFMMDLDHFKVINDTLGHAVGDDALVEASKIFKRSMEGVRGIVARIGGDEFVILAFMADENGAEQFKQGIYRRFEEFRLSKEKSYELKCSVGYCMCEREDEFTEVLKISDAELYREKKRRNAGR